MPSAILVANGEITDLAQLRAALRPEAWWVAADGGLRHFRALGLWPQMVIGDLDSAPVDEAALRAAGVQVERHPTHKDETDLELALRYLKAAGVDRLTLFGALGGRWDHALANLLLLAHPAWASLQVQVVDGPQTLFVIRQQAEIFGEPGALVSLLPLGGDAQGVTTTGLAYPLTNGTLPFGTSLGVSNLITTAPATVQVQSGVVLCVLTPPPQNPPPTAG